jgi:hypothetical protein
MANQPPVIIVQQRGSPGALAGAMACVLGVLVIFTLGIVFVPLSAIRSVVGLIRGISGGSATGIGVSVLGGALTVVGFMFSPSLWVLTAAMMAGH